MANYRSTLPPLDLLIFFEAARRVGSFTGCASELHVSQAAVSKRIRQLEDWIGEPLFLRNANRVTTTESGEQLYHTVAMALEFLRRGLSTAREQAAKPLSIGAHTVVGMFWLTAQLQAFGLSGDACPTRLTTSDNTGDLLAGDSDLLLIYSDGDLPGWETTLLLREEMVPMASPELAATLPCKTSFAQLRGTDTPPLLDYARGAPDWIDWRAWFSRLSIKGPDGWTMRRMNAYSQTIGEAIRGNGIALGSVALLTTELETQRLVTLGPDVLRTDRGYYLCRRDNAPIPRDAQRLADFLLASAAASGS